MNKVIVFFFTGFLAYHYNPNPDLDLYRYYEYAKKIGSNGSILTFIRTTYFDNFDFIYFTSFFIFNKLGIAKEFVTALFVGLFYSQALLFMELVEKQIWKDKKKPQTGLTKAFALLSVTPIFTLSISRTLAAISIFLIGVNFFLKGRKISYLFFLTSIFTHVVMLVYITGLFLFYRIKILHIGNSFYRNTVLISATVLGLSSNFWISEVLNIIKNLPFFSAFVRYSIYVDPSESKGLSIFDVLVFYDIFPILLFAFIFLIGLLKIRQYTNMVWVAYYFYIMLTIFIGYSAMLTQRAVMFMLPLQGLVAIYALSQSNRCSHFPLIYKALQLSSIIIFILNVYSYRFYLFN